MYIEYRNYLICFIITFQYALISQRADGACTFPSGLHDVTWQTSDMGDVTFNSSHFVSSMILDFGSLTFECVKLMDDKATYYGVSNAFTYLTGDEYKVSLCITIRRVNNYKFMYYPRTSVLANTDVNRVFFQQATYSFTSVETCDLMARSIDVSQVRVMIQKDFHNESTVDCNNGISGRYEYNLTGTSCPDTWMDGCSTPDQVTFNYTLCSEIMSYSAGGQLSCVYNRAAGGLWYTLMYNHDASPDDTTTFRYVCMITRYSQGVTYVTTYPRACLEKQNASAIASPGVSFFMVANNTCTGSTSAASTGALSAGAAAAVVIALLILVGALVVVGIWYYIKVYRVKKVAPGSDMIASKSPPVDTKDGERLDGRVSPFSPYPTVSELAVYRFGPSPGPEIDDDDGGMTLEATTPGFTEGRRTIYGKEAERESQVSIPLYSEVGGDTPEPTRLSEVDTRMSEVSEMNIADPTPFTMTRATMNIPEESRVSPLSPRENGGNADVTL